MQSEKEYDPEWVKEIANDIYTLKKQKITAEDKRLIRNLFLEYLNDGLKPKEALNKAKNVILSFKN